MLLLNLEKKLSFKVIYIIVLYEVKTEGNFMMEVRFNVQILVLVSLILLVSGGSLVIPPDNSDPVSECLTCLFSHKTGRRGISPFKSTPNVSISLV